MTNDLTKLLAKINSTADFSYVDFSDVNACNCLGENALHIAVRWGDVDAVKLLITSGVDVNKHGEEGYTPLHYACEEGNLEIVRLLLDGGSDPYARTEGDLPFTMARLHGNDPICDLLSQYMKKSQNRPNDTPATMHTKALAKQIEILEEKVRENCDKNV